MQRLLSPRVVAQSLVKRQGPHFAPAASKQFSMSTGTREPVVVGEASQWELGSMQEVDVGEDRKILVARTTDDKFHAVGSKCRCAAPCGGGGDC